MKCECYEDEIGRFHECPICEHDRILNIELEERMIDAIENAKPIGE